MLLLEGCRALVLPARSGCCFKKKKKKNKRDIRDIAQVKEAQTMWQAEPCWRILCGMNCFPQISSPHLKELCWFYGSHTRTDFFCFWLSTLGTFFGASFTQPELLMIWALPIYTQQWLKIPVCSSYCTLFQCTGGKQSHCLPYVSNNKHKTGD